MDLTRLKLTLSYTGTAYAGWQIQSEKQRRPTVQGEIEKALNRVAGRSVRVHGSGRTDSGVHAEGQTAHADVPRKTRMDWRRALNVSLPRDIRVLEAREVPGDFHARHDAVGKLYAYTLYMDRSGTPPRLAPFAWTTPALDLTAMEKVAALLTGTHDFASFRNVGTPVTNTVRTIWSIQCVSGRAGPFVCPEDWPAATWFFHGDGFLKQMVRNLMGAIVWAGLGKLRAADVAAGLAAKDRKAVSSPTAPPEGLTLARVEYPKE